MEGRVTTWNDQVASRRRGISGRFISLSKRWTGFGSARGAKSSTSNSSGPSGNNYDPIQGFYSPESSEVTMHRLADYAFMLRDWKLASSIYDILRADFNDDKAWNHHAVANEMAALSILLTTQNANSKARTDMIDAFIDSASYSYLTRCGNLQNAVRCLILAIELYRSRGGPATGDAARWGQRLLELSIMSPLTNGLLIERLTVCYAMQQGVGTLQWGSRSRKEAFSHFLAAEVWLRLARPGNAKARLHDASVCYGMSDKHSKLPSFPGMQQLWAELQEDIATQGTRGGQQAVAGTSNQIEDIGDEVEDYDTLVQFDKSNRRSFGSRQFEGINLLQRLNDPLDQADDGFV